jgi:ATP-dependent protease ClpP protease subunit
MNFFHITRDGTSATVTIAGESLPAPSGTDAKRLVEKLEGVREADVFIDSIGGDAAIGLAVARAIREIPKAQAFVRNALSSAAIITCACQHVAIEEGGTIMIHRPVVGAFGNVDDLRRRIIELEPIGKSFLEFICGRPRIKATDAREWLSGRDRWFMASQAVGVGLADEVIPARPLQSPRSSQETESRPTSLQDDDEAAFFEMLEAFGSFRVADQTKFAQRLNLWALRNIQGGSHAGG